MTEQPRHNLRVGDRIRFVAEPSEWLRPGYHLPSETRKLVRFLIARRHSLRIYEIDEWGTPWINCRVPKRGGGWVHHSLAIIESTGWVRVQQRKRRTLGQ